MSKFYSTHNITDGKWEVTFWIREDDELSHSPQRPDLRALIDKYYESSPLELATAIIESVLHCERVQVNTLAGTGVYVER